LWKFHWPRPFYALFKANATTNWIKTEPAGSFAFLVDDEIYLQTENRGGHSKSLQVPNLIFCVEACPALGSRSGMIFCSYSSKDGSDILTFLAFTMRFNTLRHV
jgi:hypothetical protein